MLLSGPAGGVAGAVWVAEQSGYRDLLTFDMGGTSTDIALVQGLKPRVGRETKVGDLTVRAAAVDVRTVGAGGGSIAHVPELTKALRVGPQSAGADPGPVAYGKGGSDPTVTDANLVLGYLPTSLAGGEITLDAEAARSAVQKVADAMGLASAEEAAAGIVDIVNENMLGGLRLVSVQQGFDPRDFALVAFGGAGPLHANALGKLTGAWPVIVPPSPGRAVRPGRRDHLGPGRIGAHLPAPVRRPDRGRAGGDPARLSSAASGRLAGQGIAASEQQVAYQVDVRYFGQGFDIAVDVDPAWLRRSGRGAADHRRAGSTPSTSGSSRSSCPWTTSSSTPAPRSAGRGRRSPRRCWNPAPATRRPRAPGRRASTWTAAGGTPPGTTGRCCGRATCCQARPSSRKWTPPPWSCPATSPPSTAAAAC